MRDAEPLAKPTCLVIAVYFGKLPSYFSLFIRSIAFNSGIDFLLITDQLVPVTPKNLKVKQMTLDQFRSKTAAALEMNVSMPRPYKICDFRPAFGHIFAEDITGYTHWGHCDLDVIFGDILRRIPVEVFHSYRKILVRGNFALYRNDSVANSWYRTELPDVDYRRVFSTPNPFHFDESAGILRILKHLNVPVWNEECIFNIEWEHFRMRAVGSSPGYHTYVWHNGRVLEYSGQPGGPYKVREAILIHLMKRPMSTPDFDVDNAERIVIGPDRFTLAANSSDFFESRGISLAILLSGVKHRIQAVRRRFRKRGALRPLA